MAWEFILFWYVSVVSHHFIERSALTLIFL
jgi:hypothetical protein